MKQTTIGDAIAAAATNAGGGWMGAAVEALARVASAQQRVTGDDVWSELEKRGVKPSGDARAMGAVFRIAASKGWVVRLPGEYRQSTRKARHKGPVAVWASSLCAAEAK